MSNGSMIRSAILAIGIAWLLCVMAPLASMNLKIVAAGNTRRLFTVAGLLFAATALTWTLINLAWRK